MATDPAPAGKPAHDAGTLLALQRTELAAERTLMAWVRTAFSMISFGFTIGKFLEYLHKDAAQQYPAGGGLLPRVLVLMGLASLLIGVWEFRRTREVLDSQVGIRRSAAPVGVIASLVALIGVFALCSLIYRFDF